MINKRRHHYVWQYYLSAWANDKQIWCLRDGKKFQTSTLNIAQERDFYSVTELNDEEIAFVKFMAINPSKGDLKELNEGWLNSFTELFQLRDEVLKKREFFLSKGISVDEFEGFVKVVSTHIKNIDEELHAQLESEAVRYFENLRSLNASFYNNSDDRMSFLHFVCVQYLRTKKIKEAFINKMAVIPQISNINIAACLSSMRHIYATNIAKTLISDEFRLIFLKPSGSANFIAGDQPVINTHGDIGTETIPSDTELFYPISATVAILLTGDKKLHNAETNLIADTEVENYNSAIFDRSFEQIYAYSEKDLDRFIDQSKARTHTR